MEWKEVIATDYCYKVADGTHDSPKRQNRGRFLITSKHIKGPSIDFDNAYYISEDDYQKIIKRSKIDKWDVIVSMIGEYCGFCYLEDSDFTDYAVKNVGILKVGERIKSLWLYYYLNSPDGRNQLKNTRAGSSQPYISLGSLRNLLIPEPPRDIMERTVSILSSLDRKIELNNKINADLEEMAQAIFKNWFVDFEPFKDGKFVDSELGMIPEGWKVISLSEIMKYNGGSQPPASEFIDTYQEGYIRFIQIRDYDNDSHITYIPISKRNKLCDELDIMIARYGAALGRICWGLKGAYNVALAKVTPIKSYYREYLRCYLNTSYFYQSINNKGARCAQSGFNQSDINSYMIAFPIDETVVMNFNDLCSSIMDKRLSLKYENSRLSLLRDTLLPRLMSGELEVPE